MRDGLRAPPVFVDIRRTGALLETCGGMTPVPLPSQTAWWSPDPGLCEEAPTMLDLLRAAAAPVPGKNPAPGFCNRSPDGSSSLELLELAATANCASLAKVEVVAGEGVGKGAGGGDGLEGEGEGP